MDMLRRFYSRYVSLNTHIHDLTGGLTAEHVAQKILLTWLGLIVGHWSLLPETKYDAISNG